MLNKRIRRRNATELKLYGLAEVSQVLLPLRAAAFRLSFAMMGTVVKAGAVPWIEETPSSAA